ncbi:MAG: hypothetical protein N4A33_04585 [Bacteriovoracaceae bacterium]|jgi:hypothetical protein|nr:hypothetical protein [Bacteriovoracaceae bacterium]
MNKLTLYFIPSPKPLDWSSPTKLARTIVRNQILRKHRFMGHVNVRLQYDNIDIFTGMCAIDIDRARGLLLKEKIGLGIVFHSFAGRLEDNTELEKEFEQYYEKGNERMNFIEFSISNSMAKRVHEYLDTFKKEKLDAYYGLVNSPLHCEGAGCSAFGASIMDIIGMLDNDIKMAWSNRVKVPYQLSGNPLTNNKVSLFKLLFKNFNWAKDNEDGYDLFFWDPDLMWKWTEEQIKNKTYELTKKRNVIGLKKDISQQEGLKENIFKVEKIQPIHPDLTSGSNFNKYN